MTKYNHRVVVSVFTASLVLIALVSTAEAAQSSEIRMLPIAEYMLPEGEEVAMAVSAAPPAVGANADVYELRRTGYVQVKNFVVVQR